MITGYIYKALILFNIYLAQTLGNLVYNRANYGLAAIINSDINSLFHRFVEYKSKCLYPRGKSMVVIFWHTTNHEF